MAVKKFIRYPDKRLSVKCDLVSSITAKEHEIWKDMFDSIGGGRCSCTRATCNGYYRMFLRHIRLMISVIGNVCEIDVT